MRRRLLIVVFVLCLLFALYQIISGVYFSRTRGYLSVTTTKNAAVSISQEGREAVLVGYTKGSIWLKPGVYTVTSSIPRTNQSSETITIHAQDKLSINLTPATLTTKDTYATQTNSLVKLLPFYGPDFRNGPDFRYKVDFYYTFTDNQSIPTITITAPSSIAQQNALQWITNQGYDTNKINIKYVLANP